MNPMLNVSAAVLIAAMSAVPVLAAVDSALVTMGTSTSIAPASSIDDLVGHWTMKDLDALNAAKSVTVFDTKNLYGSDDLAMISDADTRALGDLQKLHATLNGDAALKAWFARNKINPDRVITITDVNGAVDLYLY
jgi:hypothetical protein